MQRDMKEVLGGELLDNNEIFNIVDDFKSKLNQSDKMLLGYALAIIKRNDTLLGRNVSGNNTVYAILDNSEASRVIMQDLNPIGIPGTNIKVITLNYYISQLVELNFTYLQLLFVGDEQYTTEKYNKAKLSALDVISKDNQLLDYFTHKLYSMAFSINTDRVIGKFKDEEVLEARKFLLIKVMLTAEEAVNNGKVEISSNKIDERLYKDEEALSAMLKKHIFNEKSKEKFDGFKLTKDEIKVKQQTCKFQIMKDIENFLS